MQYVFVETGNESFFLHITNIFCEKIIRSIINLYKGEAFTHPGGMIDHELIREYITLHGNELCFMNCGLFPSINCCNERCRAHHITVLTSNQIRIIEESFANKIRVQYRNMHLFNLRDRLNLQRIFQAHETVGIQQVEEIQAGNSTDHNKFLCLYIKKTNKLKKNPESFVYVRAQTQSDFDYFISNTELQNIVPCDNLQFI